MPKSAKQRRKRRAFHPSSADFLSNVVTREPPKPTDVLHTVANDRILSFRPTARRSFAL